MQPNKVYESLAHLANNIIKNERLRFELFDKVLFKEQFVKQINNMLTLEKDFDQEFNGIKWATIFAKAVVKIISKNQRFEKNEGRSIEEIYADYSSFLSYTSTAFEIERHVLVDETIKFTEQDVLYNATLSESTKQYYKELEKEKIAAKKEQEQAKLQEQTATTKDNNQQGQRTSFYDKQNSFNTNQGFINPPTHPMQDSRFYPYNTKPKWMLLMKRILAVIVCLAAITLIATSIVMMNVKIDFSGYDYGKALVGDDWTNDWNDFLKDNFKDRIFVSSLMLPGFQQIINLFFYAGIAIFIAYSAFKKPKNLREKYRLDLWPILFMIIFFVLAMTSIFNLISPGQIKSIFKKELAIILKPETKKNAYNYNAFWNLIMENYGNEIKIATIFVDFSIAIMLLSIILGVTLLILNPKIDREKIMLANVEFQKASMAMMQGQTYEMDQSLYENVEEIQKKKPSKFSKWFKKIFGKKNKSK